MNICVPLWVSCIRSHSEHDLTFRLHQRTIYPLHYSPGGAISPTAGTPTSPLLSSSVLSPPLLPCTLLSLSLPLSSPCLSSPCLSSPCLSSPLLVSPVLSDPLFSSPILSSPSLLHLFLSSLPNLGPTVDMANMITIKDYIH